MLFIVSSFRGLTFFSACPVVFLNKGSVDISRFTECRVSAVSQLIVTNPSVETLLSIARFETISALEWLQKDSAMITSIYLDSCMRSTGQFYISQSTYYNSLCSYIYFDLQNKSKTKF